MQKTFEDVVQMRDLKNDQEVTVRIPNGSFKAKVVGIGSEGLIPYYIVECIDGTFPNEVYGFKFLNIPASEISVS